MQDLTEQCVSARCELRRDENVQPLVELFSSDATLIKVGMSQSGGLRALSTRDRVVFDELDTSAHSDRRRHHLRGVDVPGHAG
jgi:hypothetical protein